MVRMSKGTSLVRKLIRENSIRNLFVGKREEERDWEGQPLTSGSSYWIKELSPLANVVVARCSRILLLSSEELRQNFEDEVPDSAKHVSKYARNLLEYCSFKALAVATQVTDYLSDKDFRRLTFDMMLSWEAPAADQKPSAKVDIESTVGQSAFVRLGPAVFGVADTVSVYGQFDALTTSTGGHLPFPVYDKYLGELGKAIKTMRNQAMPSELTNLQLAKGENVIEVEGTVATQPVLQHIGVSAWPGRLTLTDKALYFESIGVVSYDKPKRFNLEADLRHVIKPELTGPWGTRLFDKAILYKSNANPEAVVLEFPEFTGHSRRDYWLAIIREIISVHQFVRKFQVGEIGQAEALSRALLGISRLRATWEVNHMLPSQPESILTFSMAEELPGGDLILQALAESLPSGDREVLNAVAGSKPKISGLYARSAVATLASLGFSSLKGTGTAVDASLPVGEFLIGDLTPLEKAVLQSRDSHKKVELAQATINGVKVDGIGTNIAVMKELFKPLNAAILWINALQSWDEPFKTSTFLIICSYLILRNLLGYVLPIFILCLAVFMIWFRQGGDGSVAGEVRVMAPPSQNTVEQLLALQQALSQVEELIKSGNIVLLKIRALLFSTVPQATDQVVIALVILSFSIAVLPFKVTLLMMLWEMFTRQMPVRQESTERILRRLREWWYSVPAVPVNLMKPEEEKKKK
eukprot:c27499_g1_i1 orf=480-2570(+)